MGETWVPPCERSARQRAKRLPAAVDGDREVERDLVQSRALLLLEPRQREARARRRREQAQLDLFDRRHLRQLGLEGAREAAAAEVPAVELLQKARRLPLAELAHGLAHEQDELRDDLLARRIGRVVLEDLAEDPRVALSPAAD